MTDEPKKRSSFVHTLPSIRLGEFDLGGVLYHANYFHLYEALREEFLRSIGLPYPSLAAAGCPFAIVESHQEVLPPGRRGMTSGGALTAAEVRRSSFTLEYSLRHNGAELHRAWTRHAFVSADGKGFTPHPPPAKLKEELER